MRKKQKNLDLIVCDCGYNNKSQNVRKYGTCTRCRKVLDKKAKFEYEMIYKLHLWRNKPKMEKSKIKEEK